MKTKLLQIKTSFEVNGVQKSQIYTRYLLQAIT